MKITTAIMDAARYYMEQTGRMRFHPQHGNPALRLSVEIEKINGKTGLAVCTQMANKVLAKVAILI